MLRAYLLLFLGLSAFAWQEAPTSAESELVRQAQQRMAENIKRLPNYTCLESIERSVRLPDKDKLLFRDRIHLDVAFIGDNEMFAWPGSGHFEAGLFSELPLRTGAIATGGFGGWIGNLFGSTAPAFTYAGACTVEDRSGSRYNFHVPLRFSTHTIIVGDRQANTAYSGFICVDPDALDIMMLEIHDEEISVPVAASSEAIRYGRSRVGSGEFLLPQSDELTITDLEGGENRTLTRFTDCRQYTSRSSISFDTEHEAVPDPQQKAEEFELPAGISLDMKLETPITFEASVVGDLITARLNRPIHASGVAVPKGAMVSGRIRALEQYYEPKKYFMVSLEFNSLTSGGKRALFCARLVGPRLGEHLLPDVDVFGEGLATSRTQNTGLDIDESAPRFGVFRVPGDRLHLPRGLHMIWETQTVHGP